MLSGIPPPRLQARWIDPFNQVGQTNLFRTTKAICFIGKKHSSLKYKTFNLILMARWLFVYLLRSRCKNASEIDAKNEFSWGRNKTVEQKLSRLDRPLKSLMRYEICHIADIKVKLKDKRSRFESTAEPRGTRERNRVQIFDRKERWIPLAKIENEVSQVWLELFLLLLWALTVVPFTLPYALLTSKCKNPPLRRRSGETIF